MKLEKRLKELIKAEDAINDGETILRACLLKPPTATAQRDKFITEALFKIRAAKTTIESLRIITEQKQGQKKKRALFKKGPPEGGAA